MLNIDNSRMPSGNKNRGICIIGAGLIHNHLQQLFLLLDSAKNVGIQGILTATPHDAQREIRYMEQIEQEIAERELLVLGPILPRTDVGTIGNRNLNGQILALALTSSYICDYSIGEVKELSQKQLHVMHLNELSQKHLRCATKKVRIQRPDRTTRRYQR